MVTKSQLAALRHGAIMEHATETNVDGTPTRCRVNGALKTWKTRPADFRLPVKHGMYTCFYITPENAAEWTIAA